MVSHLLARTRPVLSGEMSLTEEISLIKVHHQEATKQKLAHFTEIDIITENGDDVMRQIQHSAHHPDSARHGETNN